MLLQVGIVIAVKGCAGSGVHWHGCHIVRQVLACPLQESSIGQVQGRVDVVCVVLAGEVEYPLAEAVAVAVADSDCVRTCSDNKKQLIIKTNYFLC